jgi:hypothetical protein
VKPYLITSVYSPRLDIHWTMLANLQEATKELDTVCHATPKKDDVPLTTQRATSTGNWATWGQTIDNGTLKEHPPKASSSPST